MVEVTCLHCGSAFEPYGDYSDYDGPVPCAGCHKSTWVQVKRDQLVESKKWPLGSK